MSLLDFDHKRDRRSIHHRYAEVEAQLKELSLGAFQNEQLTRQRVERIEALLDRSLWGKLRWLLQSK